MKRFIIILLFGLNTWRCMAEDLTFPTNQFVKNLFENPEIQPDLHNYWDGSPDGTSARDDPNGGYLFRFEFQFKDGTDRFAFISTDRFGVGHESPPWSIFQKNQEGRWLKIAQNEVFQSGSIFVHQPSRAIIRKFPADLADPKELSTYVIMRIKEDGSIHKENFVSGRLEKDVRKMIENEADAYLPNIEKIPLAAYLLSPQTKWRMLSGYSLAAQSLDPGDVDLLSSSKNLEWSQAVKLAKQLAHSPSNPMEAEKPYLVDSTEAMPPAPEPKLATDPKGKLSIPIAESIMSKLWTIVVVVVAALALLWKLLKK